MNGQLGPNEGSKQKQQSSFNSMLMQGKEFSNNTLLVNWQILFFSSLQGLYIPIHAIFTQLTVSIRGNIFLSLPNRFSNDKTGDYNWKRLFSKIACHAYGKMADSFPLSSSQHKSSHQTISVPGEKRCTKTSNTGKNGKTQGLYSIEFAFVNGYHMDGTYRFM